MDHRSQSLHETPRQSSTMVSVKRASHGIDNTHVHKRSTARSGATSSGTYTAAKFTPSLCVNKEESALGEMPALFSVFGVRAYLFGLGWLCRCKVFRSRPSWYCAAPVRDILIDSFLKLRPLLEEIPTFLQVMKIQATRFSWRTVLFS